MLAMFASPSTLNMIGGGVAVALLLVAGYLLGLFRRQKAGEPPLVSKGLPIVGNLMGFAGHPVKFVENLHKENGDVFSLNMFGKRMTFLVGVRVHEYFFQANDDELSQTEVYNFMTPVFGKGVVYDAPIPIRKQQFRFLSNSLSTTKLQTYAPQIIQEAEMYFNKMGTGKIDLMEKMSELIILTASRCLMGKEVREHLFEQVADLFHKLDSGITPLSVFYPNAPTPAHAARNKARDEMMRIFRGIIANRIEKNERHNDMLDALIQSEYSARGGAEARKLKADEITGLMIAALFAGQHTSSITTSWTALHIMNDPEVMRRVLEEQREVLGDDLKAPLTRENINRMPFLKNCISEALRMHPPLIYLMRYARQPLHVKGALDAKGNKVDYVVPAGDRIFLSPAISMNLEDAFPDPHTYKPDRHAPENSKDRHPWAWLGFGHGLHACMGQQFAYLQIASILSVFFRTYKAKLVSEFPEADYTAMVVCPKKHVVELELRDSY